MASLSELEARVAALEADRADHRAVMAELGTLSERLGDTNVKIDDAVRVLSGRLDDVHAKVDVLSGRLEDTNVKVDVLSGRLEDTNVKVDVLSGRLDDVHAKVDVLSGRLDDVHTKVDVLSGRLDDVHAKVDVLSGRLEDTNVKVDAHREAINALGEKLSGFRGEVRDRFALIDGNLDLINRNREKDRAEAAAFRRSVEEGHAELKDLILQALDRRTDRR